MKKMRILWFEVSTPGFYVGSGAVVGGWQDSLENIVKNINEIELYIVFEGKNGDKKKTLNGVTYIPIIPKYKSLKDRLRLKYDTWGLYVDKLLSIAIDIVHDINPDVIHIFGSEWCWGLIAKFVPYPVVIHMQGSIPPYQNASYPPGYNFMDYILYNGLFINRDWAQYWNIRNNIKRAKMEETILGGCDNYMGRTDWDKGIVKLYNSNADYYYCSEALRPEIINSTQKWSYNKENKIKLITIGCTSLLKGIDTILKTAKILKEHNVDFEWILVGKLWIKDFLEYKEKIKFEDVNIKLTGFLGAEALTNLLIHSTMYIHTAYIDNSPNSVCEAQYLGVPVIATYVGGIPSLIDNGRDGFLIPVNDPFTLANKIMYLSENENILKEVSSEAIKKAVKRHSTENIIHDLLTCYKSIISKYQND